MYARKSLALRMISQNLRVIPAVRVQSTAAAVSAKDFKEIPGPLSLPFIGTLYKYMPLIGEYNFRMRDASSQKMYEQYGKIVRQEIFPSQVLIHLYDPTDVEVVFRNEGRLPHRLLLDGFIEYRKTREKPVGLANMNGEAWHHLRRESQKHMMKPRTVASYIPLQDPIGADFIDRIRLIRDPVTNEVPNLLNEFYKWAMESIGVVIFEKRLGTLDPNLTADSEAQKFVTATNMAFDALHHTTLYWPLHKNKKTKAWKNLCESLDYIWDLSMKYAKEAMDNIDHENPSRESSVLVGMLSNPKLSLEECMSLTSDFLFAGVDTTSHTTAFCLYHLTRNMEAQKKLQEEIDRELVPGEPLTPHSFDKLPYMRACLKESQRLNPIVGAFTRTIKEDLVLSGYRVPAGTNVFSEAAVMCRMEEHFPDPDKFIPERWLRGSTKQKQTDAHPFIFLPFGFGSRSCIGRRFAEQEVFLVLIKMMQNFTIENHHGDIGLRTRLINMPSKPLRFAFVDRH